MTADCRNIDARRRLARAAILAALIVAVCALTVNAQTTPSTETTPSALFQNSTLTSTTNTINVTQLPVVTSKGTSYFNLTIPFDVSEATDGTITITPGTPQQTAAPRASTDSFKAGTYRGPDDSTELITVSGPGVAPNGSTVWTIAPATGSSGCLVPYSAMWYDVGTDTAENPLYLKRLKGLGLTAGAIQFGTGAAGPNCDPNGNWYTDTLLGFSQTGNALTIASYSYWNGNLNDSPTQVDQRTYTLVQ
jgi:hypothetical protein